MNFSDVLEVIGAVAGLALMLVMAVVPLLTDRHRTHSDRPQERTATTTVSIPVQRGARGLVPAAGRPARLHAASR